MTSPSSISGEGGMRRIITLGPGRPTPADLYLDGKPLSTHIGWPETLACLDRAIKRLFHYFRAAQDRPDRTSLDIFLFEGGWVYAKRDGIAGPLMWLFLLEQLCEVVKRAEAPPEIVVAKGMHVPAEFLQAARGEAGVDTPDPAGFPRHASAEMRNPRDKMGKWKWLLRSIRRVALSHPAPVEADGKPECLLVSTASLEKHRYGTLIADLRDQIGHDTRVIGVRPKERPWADDIEYAEGILSPHRGGGIGVILRAAWMAGRLLRRHRYLRRDMAQTDPVLASMLTYRYPHLFHALLHALCVEKMVRRLRPRAFIRNGNYNTPDERRTNWACRRAGVPTIVVTPRSLSPRMPAMPMDYTREHASLPTGFVVSDDHSRDLLQSWGVPSRAISLGSLEILSDDISESSSADDGPPCLLLLIDSPEISLEMVRQVRDLVPALGADLLVRAHPLLPLAKMPEVTQALEGLEWHDVTGILMRNVIRPGRTLAVSPCSGAGVDAVRCGAKVLWVPFLSSNAPAHVDAITSTGTICESEQDLIERLDLLRDPDALAAQARNDRETLRNALNPSPTPLVDAVRAQIAVQAGAAYTPAMSHQPPHRSSA